MVPVSMAVMLLLLCSCTSGTGEPQAQYPSNPPIGAVAVILKPEQVSRPIDSFYPTPDQIVHLAMARQEQMNHCLSAAGINQTFAYPPAPSITVFALTIAEDRVTRSSLWGFFDPANAAKYGYQHSAAAKTTLSIPPQTKEAQQKCPLTSSTTRDPLTFVFDWSLPDKGPPTPGLAATALGPVLGPAAPAAGFAASSAAGVAGRAVAENMATKSANRAAQIVATPDIPKVSPLSLPQGAKQVGPIAENVARGTIMAKGAPPQKPLKSPVAKAIYAAGSR